MRPDTKFPGELPCPRCGREAVLRHRRGFPRWECPAHRWVYSRCIPGTIYPSGVPSELPDKRAKRSLHVVFDLLWCEGHMDRASAYAWLAAQLGAGAHPTDAHIANLAADDCKRIERLCREKLDRLRQDRRSRMEVPS